MQSGRDGSHGREGELPPPKINPHAQPQPLARLPAGSRSESPMRVYVAARLELGHPICGARLNEATLTDVLEHVPQIPFAHLCGDQCARTTISHREQVSTVRGREVYGARRAREGAP